MEKKYTDKKKWQDKAEQCQAGRFKVESKHYQKTDMQKKVAQLYKGKFEELDIKFSRVWSMPCKWTFSIHPINVLLYKYMGDGKGWIDPFAGKSYLAEITNDNNPERKAKYCMEAIDFSKMLNGRYKGVLFDPPYNYALLKKHYKEIKKDFGIEQSRTGFYEKVKSNLCEKIKKGGYAISFGWNSNGFGKARGFQIIEIMIVAHGGSRNDTMCIVEKKMRS